jgi:hypothetical protein
MAKAATPRKQTTQSKSRKYREWHKAILALIQEPTVASAARLIGLSERTLELWMRDPDFIKQLHHAQQSAIGHGMVVINMNLAKNLQGLQTIADDLTVHPATRAAAYGKLIDIVLGVQKQQASARYIENLENQLKQVNSGATVEELTERGEENSEEGDAEETSRQTKGKTQRKRELPAIGGTFGSDAGGGPSS